MDYESRKIKIQTSENDQYAYPITKAGLVEGLNSAIANEIANAELSLEQFQNADTIKLINAVSGNSGILRKITENGSVSWVLDPNSYTTSEELQGFVDSLNSAIGTVSSAVSEKMAVGTSENVSDSDITYYGLKSYIDSATGALTLAIAAKQDPLVSGTDIKTLDNVSLLGSGNISLKTVNSESLVGTGDISFKTINNESIVGSGNITIDTSDPTKLPIGTSEDTASTQSYFGLQKKAFEYTDSKIEDLVGTAGAALDTLGEVETKITTVENIAKGATVCKVFDNYSDLVTHLNSATSEEYRVGQNFYIKTKSVPDVWISGTVSESQNYSYSGILAQNTFVNALKGNDPLVVGYYTLDMLETEKVVFQDWLLIGDPADTKNIQSYYGLKAYTDSEIGALRETTSELSASISEKLNIGTVSDSSNDISFYGLKAYTDFEIANSTSEVMEYVNSEISELREYTNSEISRNTSEMMEYITSEISGLAHSVSELSAYAHSEVSTLSYAVSQKQDALVSGTNIKTINGTSVLGEGDIVISTSDKLDIGAYGDSAATQSFYGLKKKVEDLQDYTNSEIAATNANLAITDAIAKGATIAKSFDTYAQLVSHLNNTSEATRTAYRLGQNFYVKTKDVPDLWISGVASENDAPVTYTYTTDAAFKADILSSGATVGYYTLYPLETEKVDISNLLNVGTSNDTANTQSYFGLKSYVESVEDYAESIASDLSDLQMTVANLDIPDTTSIENRLDTLEYTVSNIEIPDTTGFIPKVSEATPGNLPVFGENGTLVDSGKTPTQQSGSVAWVTPPTGNWNSMFANIARWDDIGENTEVEEHLDRYEIATSYDSQTEYYTPTAYESIANTTGIYPDKEVIADPYFEIVTIDENVSDDNVKGFATNNLIEGFKVSMSQLESNSTLKKIVSEYFYDLDEDYDNGPQYLFDILNIENPYNTEKYYTISIKKTVDNGEESFSLHFYDPSDGSIGSALSDGEYYFIDGGNSTLALDTSRPSNTELIAAKTMAATNKFGWNAKLIEKIVYEDCEINSLEARKVIYSVAVNKDLLVSYIDANNLWIENPSYDPSKNQYDFCKQVCKLARLKAYDKNHDHDITGWELTTSDGIRNFDLYMMQMREPNGHFDGEQYCLVAYAVPTDSDLLSDYNDSPAEFINSNTDGWLITMLSVFLEDYDIYDISGLSEETTLLGGHHYGKDIIELNATGYSYSHFYLYNIESDFTNGSVCGLGSSFARKDISSVDLSEKVVNDTISNVSRGFLNKTTAPDEIIDAAVKVLEATEFRGTTGYVSLMNLKDSNNDRFSIMIGYNDSASDDEIKWLLTDSADSDYTYFDHRITPSENDSFKLINLGFWYDGHLEDLSGLYIPGTKFVGDDGRFDDLQRCIDSWDSFDNNFYSEKKAFLDYIDNDYYTDGIAYNENGFYGYGLDEKIYLKNPNDNSEYFNFKNQKKLCAAYDGYTEQDSIYLYSYSESDHDYYKFDLNSGDCYLYSLSEVQADSIDNFIFANNQTKEIVYLPEYLNSFSYINFNLSVDAYKEKINWQHRICDNKAEIHFDNSFAPTTQYLDLNNNFIASFSIGGGNDNFSDRTFALVGKTAYSEQDGDLNNDNPTVYHFWCHCYRDTDNNSMIYLILTAAEAINNISGNFNTGDFYKAFLFSKNSAQTEIPSGITLKNWTIEFDNNSMSNSFGTDSYRIEFEDYAYYDYNNVTPKIYKETKTLVDKDSIDYSKLFMASPIDEVVLLDGGRGIGAIIDDSYVAPFMVPVYPFYIYDASESASNGNPTFKRKLILNDYEGLGQMNSILLERNNNKYIYIDGDSYKNANYTPSDGWYLNTDIPLSRKGIVFNVAGPMSWNSHNALIALANQFPNAFYGKSRDHTTELVPENAYSVPQTLTVTDIIDYDTSGNNVIAPELNFLNLTVINSLDAYSVRDEIKFLLKNVFSFDSFKDWRECESVYQKGSKTVYDVTKIEPNGSYPLYIPCEFGEPSTVSEDRFNRPLSFYYTKSPGYQLVSYQLRSADSDEITSYTYYSDDRVPVTSETIESPGASLQANVDWQESKFIASFISENDVISNSDKAFINIYDYSVSQLLSYFSAALESVDSVEFCSVVDASNNAINLFELKKEDDNNYSLYLLGKDFVDLVYNEETENYSIYYNDEVDFDYGHNLIKLSSNSISYTKTAELNESAQWMKEFVLKYSAAVEND